MRPACVLTLAALALLASAASAAPLEFREGAAMGGTLRATGQWLVLWLDDGSRIAGLLSNPEPAEGVNATRMEATVESRAVGIRQERLGARESEVRLPAGELPLRSRGAGFLYLEAKAISLTAEVPEARVHVREEGSGLSDRKGSLERRTEWDHSHGGASPILLGERPAGLEISAQGVTRASWAGLAPPCLGEGCPRGGGSWGGTRGDTAVADAELASFAFESFALRGASVQLAGTAAGYAFAGPSQDAAVAGWMRLPLATTGAACMECPHNQTLWARGNLTLEGIRPGGPGLLAAEVSGIAADARLDERAVGFLGAGAAVRYGTAGASLAVGALLAKLFWSVLATRQARRPLDHPRRKAIHDLIVAQPGITFRAIVRGTGIPVGTAAHHVAVLKRAGLLMERAHRSTRRFFQNHGRHDADWAWVVLLREPAFRQLHDEVVRLVPCPQKDILARMAQAGWSRSTTQHRLDRMVENGILSVRLQGRLKLYDARPWPAARPAPALAGPEAVPAARP